MRTLSSTLDGEQRKPTRKPAIKVEVQAYGHPQASSGIQWELFGWQRFYAGSETQNYHGVCLAGDGSLSRIRLSGTTIYHSRVASPGPASDYSSWTNVGSTLANIPHRHRRPGRQPHHGGFRGFHPLPQGSPAITAHPGGAGRRWPTPAPAKGAAQWPSNQTAIALSSMLRISMTPRASISRSVPPGAGAQAWASAQAIGRSKA